ncbi:MAG: hypothetical protein IIB36_06180 [Gemmatimonadetes bacterium]|nr:hypothetical protein [Gemmatimonadota bacterium]
MSASDAWTRLGAVAPADLTNATLELHWAAQFIAAAGQSFAEPREDDSHRAMTWDASRREFMGEPFAGAYPFRVGLRPADLTLLLLDQTDEPLGSLPLAGKTREEGHEWLLAPPLRYRDARHGRTGRGLTCVENHRHRDGADGRWLRELVLVRDAVAASEVGHVADAGRSGSVAHRGVGRCRA